MINAAEVARLIGLVDRLERMPLASHTRPERPHAERSELVAAFHAAIYDMRRRVEPAERGAIRSGDIVVAGRRIPVLTRRRP